MTLPRKAPQLLSQYFCNWRGSLHRLTRHPEPVGVPLVGRLRFTGSQRLKRLQAKASPRPQPIEGGWTLCSDNRWRDTVAIFYDAGCTLRVALFSRTHLWHDGAPQLNQFHNFIHSYFRSSWRSGLKKLKKKNSHTFAFVPFFCPPAKRRLHLTSLPPVKPHAGLFRPSSAEPYKNRPLTTNYPTPSSECHSSSGDSVTCPACET